MVFFAEAVVAHVDQLQFLHIQPRCAEQEEGAKLYFGAEGVYSPQTCTGSLCVLPNSQLASSPLSSLSGPPGL